MKKSLLVLGAIAALAFVGCKHGTTTPGSDSSGDNGGTTTQKTQPAVASITSATLEDNLSGGGNYQAVISWLSDSNEYLASVGDKISITIKGSSDKDIANLKAFLVDNTKDAGWWTLTTDYLEGGAVKKGDFEVTLPFEIIKAPTSKEPAALKLGLYDDDEATYGEANLTITSFTAKVE